MGRRTPWTDWVQFFGGLAGRRAEEPKKAKHSNVWGCIFRVYGEKNPLNRLSPIFLAIGVRDVITWFKFGDDRLRGFRSAEGQILPFPIDFDGRPYNTLTLPCERVILGLEDIGVTTLTFWGHVTSSVTWPFNSQCGVSYRWSMATIRLSGTFMETCSLEDNGVTTLIFLGSRDVIGHVTIRLPMWVSYRLSMVNTTSIWNGYWDIQPRR